MRRVNLIKHRWFIENPVLDESQELDENQCLDKNKDLNDQQLAISQLNNAGFAPTKLRQLVCSIFYKNNAELTVNDIYQILQKDNTPASLSTIYSVVNRLCLSGILMSSSSINGARFYALHCDRHSAHLVCCKCGNRVKIDAGQLIESCKHQVRLSGFETDAFSLSIHGICKICLARHNI